MVAPDCQLELVKKDETGFTLHEFNELVYGDKKNKALIDKALKVEALLNIKKSLQSAYEM